jgi:hypothetical protein
MDAVVGMAVVLEGIKLALNRSKTDKPPGLEFATIF